MRHGWISAVRFKQPGSWHAPEGAALKQEAHCKSGVKVIGKQAAGHVAPGHA